MSTEPTAPAEISLQGFKNHAKVASSDREDALQRYLNAACETVQHLTAVDVTEDHQTLRIRATGSVLILPIVRVDAVESVTDPAGDLVALADLDVDLLAGLITLREPSAGTWVVRVSVQLPDSLVLATYIIATHLLQTERGSAGRR